MTGQRVIGFMTALFVLLAGGWLLLGALNDDASRRGRTGARAASIVQWESRTVRQGLEELSESENDALQPLPVAKGEAERMPPAMRRAVGETMGEGRIFQLDFDRAQRIRMPLGVYLWLVEGRGVTCVFRDKTATSFCQTTVTARKHGLLLEVYRPSKKPQGRPTHFLALGLAPQWARSALVKVGGRRRTIAIGEHRFALRAEKPIEVRRLTR